MENKMILVIYVKHPTCDEYDNIREEIENTWIGKDQDIRYLIVSSDENKIECINPVLVSEEEYKKVEKTIERLELELEKRNK